jgi:hypothetical protein
MITCKGCGGSGVMVLEPQNWIAPCLMCSAHRSLRDIEADLGGNFEKDANGQWRLVTEEERQAEKQARLEREREEIQLHNERMLGGPVSGAV